MYIGQPDITVLDGKLESGDIDIALGFETVMQLPAHLHRVRLFQDRMACMVRRDHPHVGDELTFAQFVDMKHVLISSSGKETGIIDEVLASRGLQRRIGLILTHFLPTVNLGFDKLSNVAYLRLRFRFSSRFSRRKSPLAKSKTSAHGTGGNDTPLKDDGRRETGCGVGCELTGIAALARVI